MGGKVTFPICRGCHDTKDRFPPDAWNPSLAFGGLQGLWSKATRDERLVLLKLFHITGQLHAALAQID
jgi:hypothetical protein